MIAFLLSKAGKYVLIIGCIGIALFCFGDHFYQAGERSTQAKWDAEKAKTAAAVAKVATEQASISATVDTEHQTKTRVIYLQGKTIEKQVTKYIPVGVPDLPGGFRLLHDASASGVPVPESPGVANGASVPVATVATTVSENYTGCRINEQTVLSWQEWAKQQQALHN